MLNDVSILTCPKLSRDKLDCFDHFFFTNTAIELGSVNMLQVRKETSNNYNFEGPFK